MLEVLRKMLSGAKHDDEVYTVLRVAVRAGLVSPDEANGFGALNGIDYANWHNEGVPGCRV